MTSTRNSRAWGSDVGTRRCWGIQTPYRSVCGWLGNWGFRPGVGIFLWHLPLLSHLRLSSPLSQSWTGHTHPNTGELLQSFRMERISYVPCSLGMERTWEWTVMTARTLPVEPETPCSGVRHSAGPFLELADLSQIAWLVITFQGLHAGGGWSSCWASVR